MSGDINGLPGDNTRTREATKTSCEADGPEHVKQPKQSVRLLGRMGADAGPSLLSLRLFATWSSRTAGIRRVACCGSQGAASGGVPRCGYKCLVGLVENSLLSHSPPTCNAVPKRKRRGSFSSASSLAPMAGRKRSSVDEATSAAPWGPPCLRGILHHQG
jgi:hypothetical protein